MGWWRSEPCRMARCNECGYLGRLAKNGADLPLQEYVAETRRIESIYRPNVIGWCFKGRMELQREDDAPLRTAEVLREHDCPEFVGYRPGYTPKELQELLMDEFLREREDRRDKDQRDWQKSQNRWMIGAIILAGAVGAVISKFLSSSPAP